MPPSAFSDYRELLYQGANRLPQGVKVVLLADRGFVHLKAMQMLSQELGWHYRIRLKRNTWLWRAGKGWQQLKDFHLQRGEALCLHTVKLHKQEWYGPVHVALGYNNINGEFWAIVSDEPTNLQTFREYGLRFDIEEAFLDDQSSGWNLQKIRTALRLRSVSPLVPPRGRDALCHGSRGRGGGVRRPSPGRPPLVSWQQLFPHRLGLDQNRFGARLAAH
ncbi:transposase [Spirulina major]|uniref:transposase n=1 Tax=Spirulina major TaxID=270636 RepID=UPI001C31C2E3|nr:transposase [Spirulina major]